MRDPLPEADRRWGYLQRLKLVDEWQAALSKWDGCIWHLDEYQWSHSTFWLRVYADGRPVSLVIGCHGPRYIRGPTGWSGCRLTVRVEDAEPTAVVVFRDEAADFEIRCSCINIIEKPPPHWVK